MNNLQFEKVYDLSVLVYTDMQLHPAEEAAGARAFIERHDMPEGTPSINRRRPKSLKTLLPMLQNIGRNLRDTVS